MWTDTEVHAYVVEAVSTGSVPVQVVTATGMSNVITPDVTARQSDGRVRWISLRTYVAKASWVT